MKIGIMKKGDKVLNVTAEYVALQRKNGEVDIIPIVKDEAGFRVDTEAVITIGYGESVVEHEFDDIKVINF